MKMMKALLISVLLGAFIAGGCSNSWDDPSSDRATGTVLLTFTSADARTALPEAPQFTQYKLKAQRYVDSEESGSPVEKDITGTTGSMALVEGRWKITVIGYVQENVAAVGESVEFAVTAGASTEVSITLYAVTDQGDGLFTYEISPPSDVELEWAKLTFGEGEAETLTVNDSGVYAGSIASAPGVYLVKLEMKTAYQSLIRTELAHIYSNRVTPKVWEIAAADFATYFTLSGTIDTTERAVSAIEAYTADGDQPYGLYQGAAAVTDGAWSMALPVFEEETALFFKGTYQNKQITTESSITIPQNTTETYNATPALVFPRPNPLIWEWKAGDAWTSGSIINGVGVLNTGGTVSNTNDGLSMGGARWVLGYTASQTATTNTTNVNYGTLDLSDGFMVTIEYASSNGSGNFYVYLDNNTTGGGSGPLKYTSNTILKQVTPDAGGGIINFTIKPSDVSLTTSSGLDVPTLLQTAFLQFRCDSSASSMLITHILIASKSVAIETDAVSPLTPDEGIGYQAQLPDYPSGGVQLNAIVTSATDETESDITITWSIDPTSGASVTDGVVSITAAGTYTVTAHVGALSASYKFKILPAVASVSIVGDSTVSVGKTITLTAPVSPDDAVQGVTWSVDNTDYATIDADGVLTGVEEGTVTVTATSKGKGAGGIQVTDTYSVTVNQAVAVESVTVSGNTSVVAGGTITLNATVAPDGAVQSVTWAVYLTGKEDASGIAAIDQNGLLTAGYPETETIVYVFATSVQDVTKASEGYAVTIGARPAVASVNIEGESTVRVGKTITLTATVSPEGAVQDVTWSVDNTDYATIDADGVLTGVEEGTVKVTATSKGNTEKAATHTVTVTAAVENKYWNDFGSSTEGITLGGKAEVNSSKLSYNSQTYTTRIRFGGKWQSGDNATRYISIEVAGPCTISVLMASGSGRSLELGSVAGGSANGGTTFATTGSLESAGIYNLSYTGGAGTLYLYPVVNDVSIYTLSIEY